MLTGIACMFKQVAIVNWFLLAALYPIFAGREKRWRRAVSFVVWSAAGLLSVVGLVVLYFWRHGALHDFVDNVFTHNLNYIAAVGAQTIAASKSWRAFPLWSRRVAVVLALAVLPAITLWPFLFTYTPAEAVRKIYPGDFFAEMPQFARRLETLTPPDKRVFVFGAEPELLFYARRASATRYIFLFPLYGPYGN